MSSSNNETLFKTGGAFAPQRRASPQPRQARQRSGRGHEGKQQLSAGARSFQPPSRSASFSGMNSAEDISSSFDKAELAQQVLATINIKRREDEDRRMGIGPPARHPQLQQQHHRKGNNGRGGSSKRASNQVSHTRSKRFDLGLNRFRFVLSPSSCFCEAPIGEVLGMETSELWPHVAAVISTDPDPLCSICLDGILAGRALACGHIFCGVCVFRCLEAAELDPMLQKCPVCSEGVLSRSQLRRCEVVTSTTSTTTTSFTLVRAMSPEALPPLQVVDRLMGSRVAVATGEGMLRMIERERKEVAEYKKDLARFRDTQGMRLVKDLEAEMDKAHVEWKRHVGRAKVRPVGGMSEYLVGEAGEPRWAYQRSNGALEYLHGVNVKCLVEHHQGDVS